MAAGPRDFITLATLKSWIPVAGTGDDGVLQTLITNMSAWLEQWLSRSIFIGQQTEVRDGTGTTTMMVSDWPITAVTSVTIDGTAIPLSTDPSVSGYYFTETLIGLRGYRFTNDQANVVLVYSSGYAALTHPEQVPAELAQACLEICALRYKERPFIGINSKSLAGESVSYSQQAMPKSTLELLENYKRRIPL